MKKLIAFVLTLILTNSFCYAVDLNAPAEKKITIASEMERGSSAIFEAKLKSNIRPTNILGIMRVFDDVINLNKQQNTDTDAFYLGADFTAWMSLDIILSQAKGNQLFDQDEVKLAEGSAKLYFKEFRKIQKKLNIDDITLVKTIKVNKDIVIPKIYEWDKIANKQ